MEGEVGHGHAKGSHCHNVRDFPRLTPVNRNIQCKCNLPIYFFLHVTEIPALPPEEVEVDEYTYMIDRLLSTTTFPLEV